MMKFCQLSPKGRDRFTYAILKNSEFFACSFPKLPEYHQVALHMTHQLYNLIYE